MRWKTKNMDGKKRIVTRFLLIPDWVDDDWRWLEVATREEQYNSDLGEWIPLRWIDVEDGATWKK